MALSGNGPGLSEFTFNGAGARRAERHHVALRRLRIDVPTCPLHGLSSQRECDANAKAVEIMVRLGMAEDEALRRMHAVLAGTHRFQVRTGRQPTGGHNPCEEIRDLLRRFPNWRETIPPEVRVAECVP